MWPYLLLILIILILYLLSYFIINKDRKLFFVFTSFFAILIFTVCQKTIGPDHFNYIRIFNEIAKVPWGHIYEIDLSVEYGFSLISKTFSMFSLSGEAFMRFYVSLNIILYAIICYKTKVNPLVFIFVYLGLMFSWMTILRQAMASGIVWLGMGFVREKKPFKYFLTVLLAMLFHITAVIGIVIYFVYNIKSNNHVKYRSLVIVFCIVLVIFNDYVIEILQYLLRGYRYKHYITNEDFALNMLIILVGLTFMTYMFVNHNTENGNKVIDCMFLLVLVQTCSSITPMAGRFMMYFYMFIAIAVNEIFIDKSIDPVPCVNTNYVRNKKNITCFISTTKLEKRIILCCLAMFTLFFWWYTYCRLNIYIYAF